MTDSTPPDTSAVATAEPDRPTGPLSHRQIVTILIGLMMGMFLAALDQTIVATAIRTIADDLHGLEHQAWATTAYLITATIVTPLYGKLGDIYGRKKLFIIAISIFIFGSMLCTFATSMFSLAAFRAVQGLGAGGLFSLALAIVGDIVPPRERAKYQGYFLAVFGTASVLGPVIGGFFAGQATILGIDGWRWVFLVNVPIGIAALAVVLDARCTCATTASTTASTGAAPCCSRSRSSRCCSSPSRAASGAGPPARPSPATSSASLGVDRLLLAGVADEGGGDPPAEDVPQQDGRRLLGRLGAHRCRRCSAASPPSRSTCRSSRAPPRPRPACCCCR